MGFPERPLDRLETELPRSLHIFFGEMAQLLRNFKGLIFGHDISSVGQIPQANYSRMFPTKAQEK